MNIPVIVAFSISSLLIISCIVVLILHIIRFRKYEERYNNFWSKFDNENLEKDLEHLLQDMAETRRMSEDARISAEAIEGKMSKSLQKVGIVKYDAYENGTGGLSFALAMLNARDDGVIINSIYTRNGSNIYAKQINNGIFEGNLSSEEEKALKMAKNSKSFM